MDPDAGAGFEKGFIKAEIVSFDDLVATGSIAEAGAHGKARIEGKDYVMQDGDVVEFRHSSASGGSMSAPPLPARLADQLARVPTSRDRRFEYAPCLVRLQSGEVLSRVYVVEESAFLEKWGDDPNRPFLDVTKVVSIEDSPVRLPPALANVIYEARESGMGYSVFTVHLRDGRTVPLLTGNAVDFPDWPVGIDPAEAVSVEPHAGRDQLRRDDSRSSSPGYIWCLYSAGVGS